jgi:hypothetical protein
MARHPERLAVLGRHNEAESLTRIPKKAPESRYQQPGLHGGPANRSTAVHKSDWTMGGTSSRFQIEGWKPDRINASHWRPRQLARSTQHEQYHT